MKGVIKRIFSKTEVHYEYTGNDVAPENVTHVRFNRVLLMLIIMHFNAVIN